MTKKINVYIEKLGESYETILDGYFEEFKRKMKNTMRITKSMVDQYYDHICLMVDIDNTFSQAIILRVTWLRPM